MYKYFTEDELKCRHTGECNMDDDFMKVLEAIREECAFGFVVTSAYRSPEHPIEILVHREQAFKVIEVALKHGVQRIGVAQKGDVGSRFIHLDMDETRASPRVWSY